MLVINMSTGDLTSSSASVGNKKALAAVESGINRLMQDFDPDTSTWISANNYTMDCLTNPTNPSYIWRSITNGTDANTQFAVCAPVISNFSPVSVPGYALNEWGIMRYNGSIVGRNTSYNSFNRIDIGIGYGPVPFK
jgi:hypothetical protein